MDYLYLWRIHISHIAQASLKLLISPSPPQVLVITGMYHVWRSRGRNGYAN